MKPSLRKLAELVARKAIEDLRRGEARPCLRKRGQRAYTSASQDNDISTTTEVKGVAHETKTNRTHESGRIILAAPYARYSTDRQDEASIQDQLRVNGDRIVREGWGIVDPPYIDEGLSGEALGNRPGAQRLIADAYAGKFQVIVVMELGRLARGEDLAPLVKRLKFRGVRVIGVQDAFDSNSRIYRIQAGAAGIMGGEFIDMVRARTHSALEMRAKERRVTGGRAYGYDSQRNLIDPEVQIVREIFARYARGEQMRPIANDLNLRGVPSPGAGWKRRRRRKDGRWLNSAIFAILRNELYIGNVVWNRREFVKDPETGKRCARERPREQWIVHAEPQLRIIDDATWRAVQARSSKQMGYDSSKARPTYVLSGLLDCGVCGSKFVITGGKGQRYICGTYSSGGQFACSNRLGVARGLAEELILRPVVGDLLASGTIHEMSRFMRDAARRDQIQAALPIETLEGLVRSGALRPTHAASVIEEMQRERCSILRAASRTASGSVAYTTEELVTAYVARAEKLREAIHGTDIVPAREALREVVGAIKLQPAGTHLVAHFQRGSLSLAPTGTDGVGAVVAGAGLPNFRRRVKVVRKA